VTVAASQCRVVAANRGPLLPTWVRLILHPQLEQYNSGGSNSSLVQPHTCVLYIVTAHCDMVWYGCGCGVVWYMRARQE
jgi:hypothetical protein